MRLPYTQWIHLSQIGDQAEHKAGRGYIHGQKSFYKWIPRSINNSVPVQYNWIVWKSSLTLIMTCFWSKSMNITSMSLFSSSFCWNGCWNGIGNKNVWEWFIENVWCGYYMNLHMWQNATELCTHIVPMPISWFW